MWSRRRNKCEESKESRGEGRGEGGGEEGKSEGKRRKRLGLMGKGERCEIRGYVEGKKKESGVRRGRKKRRMRSRREKRGTSE